MRKILEQQFKSQYNRKSFIDNILTPIFEQKVDNFQIFEKAGVQNIPLNESEKVIAKSVSKYGKFTTKDNRLIDLYEVILHDNKILEKNKVGIGSLIKKQIIGNNAVFVNFAYESPENKNWRFSFIAYDSVFEEGQIITNATNLKRYTYVFGEKEETYKTAIDRFLKLSDQLDIKIDNIKESFAVESMSKSFFDEYKKSHYTNFVNYLVNSNFKQSSFNGDDKNIRDFVKKLLGRIVFLYFVQKKGWLGASSTEYNDGDKNFIQNLFKLSGQNEGFYSIWLSKLFFDTLNIKRNDDNFEMPNSKLVKVPYLNGGLFEKDSDKHDYITFPPDLFKNLFDFFDQYNFTVYEDSPGDHTIAVDPEMLGHIFENLLEDNKDKGAFYTPKEIVHYMTQESLIEYLHTHLADTSKDLLNSFVKNKENSLSSQELKEIDSLLDKVKICDPAIGSGAFPMGLLQEIFALKEIISFQNKDKAWNPANAKENIIQNSIYGVDIEKGAVDIARLRFWLSLIVDEEKPKPLPNLDYKIVVGNSLVSKFEDEVIEIDWSEDTSKEGLFGYKLIEDKIKLLNNIVKKQKEYFNSESSNKKTLSFEIKKLKAEILATELKIMIETQDLQSNNKMLNGKIVNSKKQTEKALEISGWKNTLNKLKKIIENPELPFEHFDWKLNFPEILNPLVAGQNVGFDIVIGNPPYGISFDESQKKYLKNRFDYLVQRIPNSYLYFNGIAYELLKKNGIFTYIIPNEFLFQIYMEKARKFFLTNCEFKIGINLGEKIFEAIVPSCIILIKKYVNSNYNLKLKDLRNIKFNNISNELITNNFSFINSLNILESPNSIFSFDLVKNKIISKIYENSKILEDFCEDIAYGITTGCDSVYILNKNLVKENSLEETYIKPTIRGGQFNKFYCPKETGDYILYITGSYNDSIVPKTHEYLKTHKIFLINNTGEKKNGLREWHLLFRARNENLFISPKIIIRQTGDKIIASIDTDSNFYCIDSVINVRLKSSFIEEIKSFTSILNSKLLIFIYQELSQESGRVLAQVKPQRIKQMPIIQFDKSNKLIINNLVDQIMEKKKLVENTQDLEDQIDQMVYQLYELTDEEIAIVEGKENSSPAPSLLEREGEQDI